MRVIVDRELCAGCGECEDICPAVFVISDGIAKVRLDPIPPAYQQACRESLKACPVEAIKTEE